jgi:hypothetical protein
LGHQSVITLGREQLPSNDTTQDTVHYLGAFSKRMQDVIVISVMSVCLSELIGENLTGWDFVSFFYFGISQAFMGMFRFWLKAENINTHFV